MAARSFLRPAVFRPGSKRNGTRTLPPEVNSTARSRRLAFASRLRAPISRRAGPRTVAGNGKTMAEKSRKATHAKAKGRTTNGKPGRTTAGRAGARTKPAVEPQKTTPAEAPAQEPQPADETSRPGGAAGLPRPAETESHGLDRLIEKLDKMLDRESEGIADSWAKQIKAGDPGCLKGMVSLLGQKKRRDELKGEEESRALRLHQLAAEPEYQEPAPDAENNETENPQPGQLENLHAVAQD